MADLERFQKAQEKDFQAALSVLKKGRKETHWMWYIFPQFKGLGYSSVPRYYAIQSKEEALAYCQHPLLFPRLIQLSEILLKYPQTNAEAIMGYPDCPKLHSSLTLFFLLTKNDILEKVLQKYDHGERCSFTQRELEKEGRL